MLLPSYSSDAAVGRYLARDPFNRRLSLIANTGRAVVAGGRNGMSKWSSILSVEEIDAVVRYTRESLGR